MIIHSLERFFMHKKPLVRPLVVSFCIVGMALGMSVIGVAKAAPAPTATAPSKLGDLISFRDIAADVKTIVESGDLVKAKARVKNLEVRWDSAEAGLKPRAAADWHVVDKAIDRALSALRSDKPNLEECRRAMNELLSTFDAMSGRA